MNRNRLTEKMRCWKLGLLSSACVYAGYKQKTPDNPGLKKEYAYTADPEDGYGWPMDSVASGKSKARAKAAARSSGRLGSAKNPVLPSSANSGSAPIRSGFSMTIRGRVRILWKN